MDIQQISTKLPWKASKGRRNLADIKYVIVHHDASLAGETYDALQLYTQEANYHIGKGWGHLGYSFRIARDGTVYQTVPYDEIGVHAGNYSYFKNSLGICLDGDFSRQKPSHAQYKALESLMTALTTDEGLENVTRKSFFAHKEVRGVGIPGTRAFISSPTICPGEDIAQVVRAYRESTQLEKVVPTERIIKGTSPEVYAFNGKTKFHVPDMETLTFLFPGVAIQIADQELISQIPNGGDIPSMK